MDMDFQVCIHLGKKRKNGKCIKLWRRVTAPLTIRHEPRGKKHLGESDPSSCALSGVGAAVGAAAGAQSRRCAAWQCTGTRDPRSADEYQNIKQMNPTHRS